MEGYDELMFGTILGSREVGLLKTRNDEVEMLFHGTPDTRMQTHELLSTAADNLKPSLWRSGYAPRGMRKSFQRPENSRSGAGQSFRGQR